MGIAAIRRKASIHRTTGKASAFASAMSGALAILSLKEKSAHRCASVKTSYGTGRASGFASAIASTLPDLCMLVGPSVHRCT